MEKCIVINLFMDFVRMEEELEEDFTISKPRSQVYRGGQDLGKGLGTVSRVF